MIEAVIVFVSIGIIVTMATLGAVLLTKFWRGKWSRSARVALAAALGSALPLWPFGLIYAAEGASDMAVGIAGAFILIVPVLLIGWPTAFLATRKLDRLADIKTSIFA